MAYLVDQPATAGRYRFSILHRPHPNPVQSGGRVSKNQNTFEKRRREMEKKRKADDKREKRRKRKEMTLESPEPPSAEDTEPEIDPAYEDESFKS